MTRKISIAQISLWLFVIMLGIETGAGLYETFVIVPLWAGSPPDSVLAFVRHNASNPQMAIDAGGRFWIFATPTLGLLSLATLLTSRRTHPAHRRWRVFAAGLVFLVVAFTFAWFVPNILFLQSKNVLTMPPDEIASLTNWWVVLNYLRGFSALAALAAALRALSLPAENVPE
jgi:hypothetical protein